MQHDLAQKSLSAADGGCVIATAICASTKCRTALSSRALGPSRPLVGGNVIGSSCAYGHSNSSLRVQGFLVYGLSLFGIIELSNSLACRVLISDCL